MGLLGKIWTIVRQGRVSPMRVGTPDSLVCEVSVYIRFRPTHKSALCDSNSSHRCYLANHSASISLSHCGDTFTLGITEPDCSGLDRHLLPNGGGLTLAAVNDSFTQSVLAASILTFMIGIPYLWWLAGPFRKPSNSDADYQKMFDVVDH